MCQLPSRDSIRIEKIIITNIISVVLMQNIIVLSYRYLKYVEYLGGNGLSLSEGIHCSSTKDYRGTVS